MFLIVFEYVDKCSIWLKKKCHKQNYLFKIKIINKMSICLPKGKTKMCESGWGGSDLFICPNNDPLLPPYRYKHQTNSINAKIFQTAA